MDLALESLGFFSGQSLRLHAPLLKISQIYPLIVQGVGE